MVRIGGDAGLLEQPQEISELLLVPGERADLLVSINAPGPAATLVALPYERAMGAGPTAGVDLIHLIAPAPDPSAVAPSLPSRLRASLPDLLPAVSNRRIRLGERMGHGAAGRGVGCAAGGCLLPGFGRGVSGTE